MEILEAKTGDVCILSPIGRLDAYYASELEKKLGSLIDAGQVRLVINLEKLEYISSSGLRVLLSTLKKVKSLQGDIKLACLKPFIKEVFDISGFTGLFNIFEAQEAAVGNFNEA